MKKTPKTETEEEKKNRELTEGIAKNLNNLADAVGALIDGPLKRKTILILLAHTTGLTQRDVDAVLSALQTLPRDFLK